MRIETGPIQGFLSEVAAYSTAGGSWSEGSPHQVGSSAVENCSDGPTGQLWLLFFPSFVHGCALAPGARNEHDHKMAYTYQGDNWRETSPMSPPRQVWRVVGLACLSRVSRRHLVDKGNDLAVCKSAWRAREGKRHL